MAIHETIVKESDRLTAAQLAEIEAAAKRPINFQDIPPMTDDELTRVAEIARAIRTGRER